MIPNALDTLWCGAVGRMLRLEPIRRLVSQERYFEGLKPFVHTADNLSCEKDKIDDWGRSFPIRFDWCKTKINDFCAKHGFSTIGENHYNDRVYLRLAAYRAIDEWLSESPQLFRRRPFNHSGELYVSCCAGSDAPKLKIGTNECPEYLSDPRHDLLFFEYAQKDQLITDLELSLFPLIGRSNLSHAQLWRELRERWQSVAPLRISWMKTGIYPFPSGLHGAGMEEELSMRVPPLFLEQVDPMFFSEAGLCPWWPKATERFACEHRTEYPEQATDEHLRLWISQIYLSRKRLPDQIG